MKAIKKIVLRQELDVQITSFDIPTKENLQNLFSNKHCSTAFWVKDGEKVMYSYGTAEETYFCPDIEHSRFWVRPVIKFTSNFPVHLGEELYFDGLVNCFIVIEDGIAISSADVNYCSYDKIETALNNWFELHFKEEE